MANKQFAVLENRGLLRLAGADVRDFLQGMISNDVADVSADRAIYAVLLTPQGKFLFDFFVFSGLDGGDAIYLECEGGRAADLIRRLSMYKLRADVEIADVTPEFEVAAAFGEDAPEALGLGSAPGTAAKLADGLAFADPRLAALGARCVMPKSSAAAALEAAGFGGASAQDYDLHRLSLGVPDGSRDVLVEKSFPLECNLDDLNAISYTKGCYVGQELTARTHHRGTIRKRLLPVEVEGPLPPSGTPVALGEREIGEIRSGSGQSALAFLRLEHLDAANAGGAALTAGDATLTAHVPSWMELPADQSGD